MRPARAIMVGAALAAAVLGGAPGVAAAHEERPVDTPDGSGSVPVYRGGEPDLLVCKTDRADFERRVGGFPGALRARNLALFERCQQQGYRHLQEAVSAAGAAGRDGMSIAVLPGVYLEEPSLAEPAGACADLQAPRARLGHQILSYGQQQQCPHNQNLVAVLGVRGLQIEGTGAAPTDVIVDAQYRRLNGLRADQADGVYLRNFTVQRTTFNSVYVLATDGFAIDHMLTRWNDEYGFLTFATDHGLYAGCESYGNGDSGIYPGGTSDVNRDRGHDVARYAIEVRGCRSHHNMVGYSGTAGDSVWVHDSELYDNMAGASMDSAFPNHPGLPQNHALFEHNDIHDNNADYYGWVRDGTCARPSAQRGYENGVVCPAVGLPRGTGIITAGGNYNVYRDNWIHGHETSAFALFAVPAFLRGESALRKQADTSHNNRYTGNHLGVSPTGEARPNGADVWWDGQGSGNCWQGSVSDPRVVPSCGADPGGVSDGSRRLLGEPAKLIALYACSGYDLVTRAVPGGCDWYGARGLGRVQVQAALLTSVLLGIAGLLLWWRRLRDRRAAAWLTAAGLLGLVLDVLGAAYPRSLLAAAALVLLAAWWLGLGVLLRPRHRGFGWLSLAVGVLALAGAVDKSLYLIPLLPLGPEWPRGLLLNVWLLWALALLPGGRGEPAAADDDPAAPDAPDAAAELSPAT